MSSSFVFKKIQVVVGDFGFWFLCFESFESTKMIHHFDSFESRVILSASFTPVGGVK